MDNRENRSNAFTIVISVALIIALILGIKFIFWSLDQVLPEPAAPPASVQTRPELDAPSFCPFCGRELYDAFQWGQFCPYCGEKVEME